jgi:hypothetical protein
MGEPGTPETGKFHRSEGVDGPLKGLRPVCCRSCWNIPHGMLPGISVAVDVLVGVGVIVGVAVSVLVGVEVGVGVAVGVLVGVGDGVEVAVDVLVGVEDNVGVVVSVSAGRMMSGKNSGVPVMPILCAAREMGFNEMMKSEPKRQKRIIPMRVFISFSVLVFKIVVVVVALLVMLSKLPVGLGTSFMKR